MNELTASGTGPTTGNLRTELPTLIAADCQCLLLEGSDE